MKQRKPSLPILLLLINLPQTTPQTSSSCPLPRPQLSPTPLTPTWQASFPGSGSRMTWSLIQALTGYQTGDDFNTHNFGFTNVVTVKTHYPVKTARNTFDDIDASFHRAIVLLRNPLYAIPSYFNLLYERKHHLPNHSTRGSNEEWVQYREHPNHGMGYQLQMFEKFVVYWMERLREDRGNMLLISYEELTGANGDDATRRIVDFLSESNEGLHVDPEKIGCVWRNVVKFKDAPQPQRALLGREQKANPHSLREGPRERPYKREQLEELLGVFNRLIEAFSYDHEFANIMQGYVDVVSNTVPVE